MHDSKLFRLLRSLSEAERARFGLYLQSPYHNSQPRLARMYEHIRLHLPAGMAAESLPEALSREALLRAFFPEGNAKHLSEILSRIQRHLEAFLAMEQFQADEAGMQQYLLQSLSQREGAESAYEKTLGASRAANLARTGGSLKALQRQLSLDEEALGYLIQRGEAQVEPAISSLLQQLEAFTLTAQLKYALAALAHSARAGQPFDIPFLPAVLAHIAAHSELLYTPLLALYYRLARCLLNPADEQLYLELRADMAVFIPKIDAQEAAQVYPLAINYLISRIKKGESRLGEVFALYREQERNGVLYAAGFIQPGDYLNVVNTGLALSGLSHDEAGCATIRDWTESFIQRGAAYLRPEERNATLAHAKARLHYQDGQWAQAQRLLVQVRHQELQSEIRRRILLQRVYYAQGETELFFSASKANLKYLSDKKTALAPRKLESYRHFFRLSEKLCVLRLQPQPAPARMRALQAEIAATQPLEAREWLLKGAQQLAERL